MADTLASGCRSPRSRAFLSHAGIGIAVLLISSLVLGAQELEMRSRVASTSAGAIELRRALPRYIAREHDAVDDPAEQVGKGCACGVGMSLSLRFVGPQRDHLDSQLSLDGRDEDQPCVGGLPGPWINR